MFIKEVCREAKERKSLTNQDIADRSNIPISTVSNYFSGNSKAPSVYTVGPICAALGVSLDQYFGIESDHPASNATELSDLKAQYKDLQDELNTAKQNAKTDLENSSRQNQRETEYNRQLINQLNVQLNAQKRRSGFFLAAFIVLFALFAVYLICFDLPNPNYGIIRSEAFSCIEHTFHGIV